MTKQIQHGTRSGRYHYGCHCEDCVEAARREDHARRNGEKLPVKVRKSDGMPRGSKFTHGLPSGYSTYECRCSKCVKAKVDYEKMRRNRVEQDRMMQEFEEQCLSVDIQPKPSTGKEDKNGR